MRRGGRVRRHPVGQHTSACNSLISFFEPKSAEFVTPAHSPASRFARTRRIAPWSASSSCTAASSQGSEPGGRRLRSPSGSILVLDRPGFPPNPPIDRVDFAADALFVAELLTSGDHLVGHSYGGVVTLLAAAHRPELVGSLTVLEPPATRVALEVPAVARFAEGAEETWAGGVTDPAVFLAAFLAAVGSEMELPSPLPPELEQGARALMGERGAWEAEIRSTCFAPQAPALSCRALTIRHSMRSATRSSASFAQSASSHRVPPCRPAAPAFNDALADFVERAVAPRPPGQPRH
jgi:pimeloyl-ACP methyl ester carboxylesterase